MPKKSVQRTRVSQSPRFLNQKLTFAQTQTLLQQRQHHQASDTSNHPLLFVAKDLVSLAGSHPGARTVI